MRIRTILPSVLVLLAAAVPAWAGEAPKEEKAWGGQAELSFVRTTGNTDTTTLAGRSLLKYRFTPRTTGSWRLGALYSEDKGRTAAESYSTEFRVDWLYTESTYLFGLGGWSRNRFAGIDRRYYGGGGAGRRFLDGPKHFLSGEAGLNVTREEYVNGTGSDFLTGRAFARYEYAFTEKSRFLQSLEYLHDFSKSTHFKLNSETALVAALTDVFSLKASYTVRYDHRPVPAGLERTDTTTSMAVVADF